jgi:hypothetical protein
MTGSSIGSRGKGRTASRTLARRRSTALRVFAGLAIGGAALWITQAATAQQGGTSPDMAKEVAEAPTRYLRDTAQPDSAGAGPYPAIKRQVSSAPALVGYYPARLAALGSRKMPIYVFGNGACSEDGASSRQHLLDIASYGYLALAPGEIFSGPGVRVSPEGFADHRSRTTSTQLGQAIDWAMSENRRVGSPFYGRLDTAHIAMSGYSCGGIQALKYAGDPRVSTFVIMNSGILDSTAPQEGEMAADKRLLDKITVPTLYVLGGAHDIAFGNGMDDFGRLRTAPVAVISTNVGHQGTYSEPNGGRAARAVVAWLQWRLRDDQQAASWFRGKDCRLCANPAWEIRHRNF